MLRQYQQTDAVNYLVEASYSPSMMTGETYPSVPGSGDRRTVTYTPDPAGRLLSLNSNATTYAPAASVSSIGYASSNALKTETYGNALIHAVSYNNRLQPTEIKLGTSGNPTSIDDLTYSYGTTNNNGNLLSASYSGGGLSYTQSFGYDQLNRLTTSNENAGASWSQTNDYDQYGNRWIDYGGGSHNLSFSTSNNRITTAGFSYDPAGNLTNDTIHAYTFDAENKIKSVDGTSAYVYDGEGHRVKKLLGENTRFVYNIRGQLIAEFDGSTSNLKKEYLYSGATLITIEPTAVNSNGTRYSVSDGLGSPRVVTNSSGSVVSRHDYMPFGEELGAGSGGRTTGIGFSVADGNRKRFTGYEADSETGLNFAGARYQSSTQGRFTSVDSFGGLTINPQSLNRYVYASNDPLNSVDRSGKWPTRIHNEIIELALPGLSEYELAVLMDSSYSMDHSVMAQMPSYAYQHGLRGPNESIDDAKAKAASFILEREWAATRTQYEQEQCSRDMRLNPQALHYFGEALHTITDETSPPHEGFQVWEGIPLSSIAAALMGNQMPLTIAIANIEGHIQAESVMTDEKRAQAVSVARQAFRNTFGDRQYSRAISAGSRGSSIGLATSLPSFGSISLDSPKILAEVTVYPDGSTSAKSNYGYSGPKKIDRPKDKDK